MKKQSLTTDKLIEKFDNQLRDILAAEIRSVKYAKTKIMNHLGMSGQTLAIS